MGQAQNGTPGCTPYACTPDLSRDLENALFNFNAQLRRADHAEAQYHAMSERCRHFESDVERYIRENEIQRQELVEARAAMRAMAHLVTETELKAKARNLSR